MNPKGVDAQSFIAAIKSGKFTAERLEQWIERLTQTHDAQRELLVGTLHGIYCDPSSSEESRLNALSVCKRLATKFSPSTKSRLINRHNDYIAQGKMDRQTASQDLFTRLGLVALLSHAERHSIISHACQRLLSVHEDFNNFYNEPPFAERLLELSTQAAIPESAQPEFVNVIVLCATGNQYGYAWAADPYYRQLIKNFSPREIVLMLDAAKTYQRLALRIQYYPKCKQRFRELHTRQLIYHACPPNDRMHQTEMMPQAAMNS